MGWTANDIANLKAAIASGHQTVRYGERQVTYQSTNAMLLALRQMEAELAQANRGPQQATRRYTFTTLRGF